MPDAPATRCSLVVATVDRTAEPRRLLASVLAGSVLPERLVLVDQNPDDRLGPLVEDYRRHAPIVRVRCARGLSRARNVGLAHVVGDLVAFPDDDCWYPPDLLERVSSAFAAAPDLDGLTGRADLVGTATDWFDRTPGPVDRASAWTRAISYTMFLRRRVVDGVGDFDETLGVGAGSPWGSGEETDYVLRALDARFALRYDPDLVVHHPSPPDPPDAGRAYRYGLGTGRVLRKHRCAPSLVLRFLARPIGGALWAAARGRGALARFHVSSVRGRWRGWTARR